jgi:hypothetical protein
MNAMNANRRGTLGAKHGGHDPDRVLLGGLVKPETKALVVITSEAYKMDSISVMMRGVENLATAKGILKDGRITAKYADEIKALASVIRAEKAKKQERRQTK